MEKNPLPLGVRSVPLLAVFLFCTSLRGDIVFYHADLDATQAVPHASDTELTPSPATGTLDITRDTVTGFFSITIQLTDMFGNYLPCFMPGSICSGAHIHKGAVGEASQIHSYDTLDFLWTNEAGNNTPAPGDWTYTATNQTLIPNPAVTWADYDSGNVYINVHSEYMTTGEIRGQVLPVLVPEPSSMLLLLGGLALLRRKHRDSSLF